MFKTITIKDEAVTAVSDTKAIALVVKAMALVVKAITPDTKTESIAFSAVIFEVNRLLRAYL
jgi:hypothetical protein